MTECSPRDKDLLSLQRYGDITMITPEAFIAILTFPFHHLSQASCGFPHHTP